MTCPMGFWSLPLWVSARYRFHSYRHSVWIFRLLLQPFFRRSDTLVSVLVQISKHPAPTSTGISLHIAHAVLQYISQKPCTSRLFPTHFIVRYCSRCYYLLFALQAEAGGCCEMNQKKPPRGWLGGHMCWQCNVFEKASQPQACAIFWLVRSTLPCESIFFFDSPFMSTGNPLGGG